MELLVVPVLSLRFLRDCPLQPHPQPHTPTPSGLRAGQGRDYQVVLSHFLIQGIVLRETAARTGSLVTAPLAVQSPGGGGNIISKAFSYCSWSRHREAAPSPQLLHGSV